MTLAATLQALQAHATGSSDASGPGLADVLWQNRDKPEASDLQAVWINLGELFQALVAEMPRWRDQGVPVELAYAVAEILSRVAKLSLSSNVEVRKQGALLGWRVATAWAALAAGDIDDVADHVRLEEWALQIESP